MRRETRYNNKQGYSLAQIIRAQHVVGRPLYAIWRDSDVPAIKRWQDSRGLTVDGRVGAQTMTAIHLTWLATTVKPEMELWHDLSQRETLAKMPTIISDMREMEINRVVIQLDKSSSVMGFPRWRWSHDGLLEFASELLCAGIRCGVMLWTQPNARYIDAASAWLQGRDINSCFDLFEEDLEGQWRERHCQEGWSLSDAARYRAQSFKWITIRRSVTTYPNHTENSASALVACDADEVSPQGYSRDVPGDAAFNVGNRYGPGRMQQHAYDRACQVVSDALTIVMGFALFAQTGLGVDGPACGLDAAYASARALGVKMVRGWGTKHLWSKKRGEPLYVKWLKEIPSRL